MSEVSILKLRDGATVVAKVSSQDGEKFLVEHPIELVSAAGMLKQGLGEAISLKPWISIAEEHAFTIERAQVITVATLQEKFINGYHNMVEAIYFKDPQWMGDFVEEEEAPEPEEDFNIDELADYADAIIKNKIH